MYYSGNGITSRTQVDWDDACEGGASVGVRRRHPTLSLLAIVKIDTEHKGECNQIPSTITLPVSGQYNSIYVNEDQRLDLP